MTDEDQRGDGASDDLPDENASDDDLPDEPLADLAEDVRDRTGDDEGHPAADDRPRIDADADRDPSPLPGETGREGPLGDLAAEVDRRRDDAEPADLDDAFTSQEIADLDADAVWEQVESGGLGDDQGEIETDERIVSKASFCQQCEFFSEPPSVECGHEGTEILELVDTDSFRVCNCPKVAEEERLGDL